jgi:hypothetical protein
MPPHPVRLVATPSDPAPAQTVLPAGGPDGRQGNGSDGVFVIKISSSRSRAPVRVVEDAPDPAPTAPVARLPDPIPVPAAEEVRSPDRSVGAAQPPERSTPARAAEGLAFGSLPSAPAPPQPPAAPTPAFLPPVGVAASPAPTITAPSLVVPAPAAAASTGGNSTITLPISTSAPLADAKPAAPPAATPPEDKEPKRRALPAPFNSPPYPSGEYQGYPLIGVPPDTTRWPLMKLLQGTWYGDLLDSARIRAYGWLNVSANWSTSKKSNTPDSYWIVPNSFQLDQAILRVERQVDSVQTDHIDWGFRSTLLYGIDYRYMTSGGWFSGQLLNNNFLYGVDPTEQYVDVYVPGVAQGMIVRVGRWIACPDIETQFAPDNYMGSHSILFTFDTYTQTGVMATFMLNKQWMVQGAIEAGTDMAPWYRGAIATGMFGVRWVAQDNNDSIYTCLNNINNAKFRYFMEHDQLSGHDNFNYIVSTWQHRFSKEILTKTEAYFMWQIDGVLGGTPSLGPPKSFGGGGGIGPTIPGMSLTYGTVNYTMFQLSPKSFITFRNEVWKDEKGERSGFPSTYTSNSIGLTYNITPILQVRPEVGFYRSWSVPAFDQGTRKNMVMCGVDMTLRF